MDRHEMKARFDAQMDEWKRNLELMKAKADASTGDAKVEYLRSVSQIQSQLDDLRIEAGKAWDVAEDSWASTSRELQLKWDEWQLRAKKAWNELTK